MQRRDFLKASLAAGIFLPAIRIRAAAPATKYSTALIGSGWWGMNVLREAMAAGESRVVALCDVDRNFLDGAAAEVEKLSGDQPRKYSDYRELLEKEKPQIVIVATPDHWHPLQTIAALRAGAHVYVEKPIGHTINEGKAMVKAAGETGKTVQVGLHRRVSPHNVSGMEFLKSGKVGDIGMVRAFVHYGGGAGRPTPDSEPPEHLDWDMWCGPAPKLPFNRRIHPRGWRMFLPYANGQIGDWGVHWMDQILWWTDEKAPHSVYSTAARHIKRDSTSAPDTQVVTYEFESFTATWEHRLYGGNEAEKHNLGCYFYGTNGTFHMGWQDGWTFYPDDTRQEIIHQAPQLNQPDDQNIRELWADFLTSIRTEKTPVCGIESSHRATTMSLLGMLSWQLGRSVAWDATREIVPDDAAANALLQREYRAPWVYPTL